jgi:hypothetical protein
MLRIAGYSKQVLGVLGFFTGLSLAYAPSSSSFRPVFYTVMGAVVQTKVHYKQELFLGDVSRLDERIATKQKCVLQALKAANDPEAIEFERLTQGDSSK